MRKHLTTILVGMAGVSVNVAACWALLIKGSRGPAVLHAITAVGFVWMTWMWLKKP